MKLFLKLNLALLFFTLLALTSCRNPDNDIQPTCFDEIQNQGEERVDCGGPNCPPCQPSCDDGVQNQGEQTPVTNAYVTAIDCGGENCEPCSTCDDGIQNSHWVRDPNLTIADLSNPDVGQNAVGQLYRLVMESGVDCGFPCQMVCDPGLYDGIQNGDEEGIDCGGSHPDDCPPASCFDGIQNGTETGIDCGDAVGACPECPDASCNDGIQNIHIEINALSTKGYYVVIETGIDCDDDHRTSCPDCPIPTCFDGVQNGSETGIDCGGSCETLCDPEPNCNNGIQDGDELGIDCGGANCPPCPTCTDAIKNGLEYAVDCLDYDFIAALDPIPYGYEDCPICPSCHDGILNDGDALLYELDVDCGGPQCAPCEQFVTIASIGQGSGGSAFRDQYSYNLILAAAGMDTLSLDDLGYPGLTIKRKIYLGKQYLYIVANQGIALNANNTFVRTVTMYLPIPDDPGYEVGINIPMYNSSVPALPTYECLPNPNFDPKYPLIGYQEKILQNEQANKCFVSYIDGNENSMLIYNYESGGVMSIGHYAKGGIDQGSMRSGIGWQTGQSTSGKFSEVKFQLQYNMQPE